MTTPAFTEVSGLLKTSGQVRLGADGKGVLYFDPSNANQRWEVTTVVVSTNQPAAATVVPVARLALNTRDLTTMSPGNDKGASWSGNQDSFTGQVDVGPCDFLTVLFYPPPGSDAGQVAQLAGVIASVVVTGTRYTKRGRAA